MGKIFFLGIALFCLTSFTWLFAQMDDFVMRGTVLIRYQGNAEHISIPSTVASIGVEAFAGNPYRPVSIFLPSSITAIGYRAFANARGLRFIDIPPSVTSIGNYAFAGARNLSRVNIPPSVTSIGSFAFFGCRSLSTINIPSSVTSIGDSAFAGCTSLGSVVISRRTQLGRDVFPEGVQISFSD